MKEQIPLEIKKAAEIGISQSDPPLKTVLLQELERYNKLLKILRSSLAQLGLGIQGLSVITPELETVFLAVVRNRANYVVICISIVETSWFMEYGFDCTY